jgi:tetratricopeptide (TPR) repeat protein
MSVFFPACLHAGTFSITVSPDGRNDLDALPAALIKGAEDAYRVNRLGLDALENGNLDSAMICFSKASSMLPIYSEAENNKGVVHFRKGNISVARKIWESVVSKDPECSIALYNIGIAFFYENDLQNAQRYFQKAIDRNRKFVEAQVMMGRTMIQSGKLREACDNFREAMKTDRRRADAWQYYAFCLLQMKDTSGAQAILVKYKPDPEALKMLGQIEASRGNFVAASTYLSEAVSGGAMPELLVELASMQMESGKYRDAVSTIKIYEKKVKSMSADACCIAGIASKECGDAEGARSYFEKGLRNFPQDHILQYNLGQIYFLQNKYDLAENTWKSLSDDMQDPSLYYMKALTARQRGNAAEARRLIEKAISIDGKAEYYDLLGVICNSSGKKDEALSYFRKALSINPECQSAKLNMALLSQSGEGLESAAAEMEKKLSECHDDCSGMALQLSIIYYHQGKFARAYSILESIPENEKDLKIVRHSVLYLRQMKEWDKAIAVMEKAKKRFAFDEKMDYELAEEYLLAGHYAKAIDALTSVIGEWNENPWRIYYQLGYAYMEQNDLDKAKYNFELSLKKYPGNVAARGLLAFVYNMSGNGKQARALWEKNVLDDPSNPALHVNLGLSLEKEGRYDEALTHYNMAYSLKPDDNAVMINIGNVYEEMNRNTDALNAYKSALNSSRKELAAYNIFLLSEKTYSESGAEEMLNILLKEFPASAYTKRAQSESYLKAGDTARALDVIESIPDKDPVDWVTMAKIYAVKSDFKKADRYAAMLPKEPEWDKARTDILIKKAFSSNDFNLAYSLLKDFHDTGFSVQYNIALAAFNAKKFVETVAIGESIVHKAKGRDRADVCRLTGNAYFSLKQWSDALRWYEQLAGMEQGNALVLYNCAVASCNMGDIKASWDYYQKARMLDPSLVNKNIETRCAGGSPSGRPSGSGSADPLDSMYNEAVVLQRDQKNDSAAEQIYKLILERQGTYFRAWNNLGAIYSARGDLQEAVACFLHSIEKQHDVPEAYANLVNVYIAMDSMAEAQRWVIKGLGHNPDSETLRELEVKVKELARGKKKKR